MSYVCPVCGFPELLESPRTSTGAGSDEICPSCGFQFGYDDDSEGITYEDWRAKWIRAGMPWFSTSTAPPPAWNPVEQLEGLRLLDRLGNVDD
jgi:hypothetical protein